MESVGGKEVAKVCSAELVRGDTNQGGGSVVGDIICVRVLQLLVLFFAMVLVRVQLLQQLQDWEFLLVLQDVE